MALIKVEPFQIDTIANFVFGNATISSNLTSGNANLGNLAIANYFSGSGNNLSNIQAANITGEVSFAATANAVAGSNVSGYVANANIANTAYSVDVANVSGLGNIATINLDGNTSNILYGNGVFSSAPVTYGDSNVASYLPTYTGDLSPGNITIAPTNLKISGGTADYVLKTDGAGNLSWTAMTGGSGSSDLANLTDVTLANLAQGDILSYDAANSVWVNSVNSSGTGSASSQYVTRTATGDGSTVAYTVSSGASTNSVIVTLSGIVQTPTADYSVSGTTLTFTTAPANGIAIQIREIGIPMSSGSNTQLLFNDAGSIGGTTNLTFNKTTGMLTAAKLTTTSANLGSAANLRITGGNVGDLLATVGNGVLAWANVAANGNVIITGGGTSNVAFTVVTTVDSFTGDGTTTEFTLTTEPASVNNLTVNYSGELLLKNTYSISGSNITFGSAPANGAEFEVILTQGAPLDAVELYSTSNAALTAGTVTTAAQPNITSVGTLTSLDVTGNVTAGNIKTNNLLYANGDPYTFGGAVAVSGTAPVSASEGDLWLDNTTGEMSIYFSNAWAEVGGGGTVATPAGSSSQVQFNANGEFSTSANFTFNSTNDTLSVSKIIANGAALTSITGANVTGTVANATYATTSATVTTNAQPNITSVGTLANLSVSGTSILTGLVTSTFSTEVIQTKTAATGVVTHDITSGTSFYHTSPSANFTANFTNVPTTNDRVIVTALVITQGATAYIPSAVQIDGTGQTIKWNGGTAPTGSASKVDIISFSLIRTGSTWIVFGQYSDYS